MKRVLALQFFTIGLCAWVLFEFVLTFPYPSPIIQPLLPPKERWPTDQIKEWVDQQSFPRSYLTFFGRDPHRVIPSGANLVAPADGTVKTIFIRDGISYLVIGMSFWDVHVIRTPAAGIVADLDLEGIRVDRGKQTASDIYAQGKDSPVQLILTFQTDFGVLKVHMITSYWASRLKVWVRRGEQVSKGERIGRILLGSTAVLEVPGDVTFSVKPGQHVTGGESIVYSHQE